MGKNCNRKPVPDQPRWYWYDVDGCYACKHRNECNGCRMLKESAWEQRDRRDRKQKAELKKQLKLEDY